MPRRLRIGFPRAYRTSADRGIFALTGRDAALSGGGDPAITPSLTASHVSGYAPLGVHFDAIGSSSTRLSDNFRQMVYTFNYGDAGSGTWAVGNPTNNSKNSDTGGPLAFHVFETPGTYTVTLTCSDGVGTNTTTTTITVSDPDAVFSGANTICVNDSGTSDGLGPAGCTYQSSMPSAATANGKRVLMRRGQSTVRTLPNMSGAQGAYFGAYGSGAKPVVSGANYSQNGAARVLIENVRGGASTSFNVTGSNFMLLRADIPQSTQTISVTTGDAGLALDFNYNHIFVVECDLQIPSLNAAAQYATFGGCKRLVIAGCTTNNSWFHEMRQSAIYKSYIGHNRIVGTLSNISYDTVKIHAKSLTNYVEGTSPNSGSYTSRYIVFANNVVGNSTFNANYHVSFASQNSSSTEQVRDVVVEANGFYAAAAFDVATYAERVLVINNYRLNGGSVSIGDSANQGPGVVSSRFTTRS